jgi:hypothetical protein
MRIDSRNISSTSNLVLVEAKKNEDPSWKNIWKLFIESLKSIFFCFSRTPHQQRKVRKMSSSSEESSSMTSQKILIAACSNGRVRRVKRAVELCLKSDPEYFKRTPEGEPDLRDFPLSCALFAVFQDSGNVEDRLEIFRILIALNKGLAENLKEELATKATSLKEYEKYINLFTFEYNFDI